jgi:hypothetical protein
MEEQRVVEHRQSSSALWLRERRVRLALLIAFVESLLVLTSDHGWRYVAIAALITTLAYWFGGRRMPGVVYEITWVAAFSQILALLVPFFWGLLWWLGTLALVVLGLLMLAALLLDRK